MKTRYRSRIIRFWTNAIFTLVMMFMLLMIFSTRPMREGVIAPTVESPAREFASKKIEKLEKKTEPMVLPEPAAPAVVSPTPQPLLSPDPRAGTSVLSQLIIPVQGVKPESLRDTYQDARSEGRVHNAIDIMAGHGTPVLAATDGTIQRFFYSEKGGNTIYQLSTDGKWIFYYAHLDHYADDVSPGQQVKKGEVIAYVGDTGNAGAGNYHLHFAIWAVTDPKRIWEGENINPYPLLRR